ncbi:MAG: hypothetical protein P8L44_24080 [Opitutales bacterium]|jgi:hypothetical protein|nr:hypothetical protein [Opitutales bacterium]
MQSYSHFQNYTTVGFYLWLSFLVSSIESGWRFKFLFIACILVSGCASPNWNDDDNLSIADYSDQVKGAYRFDPTNYKSLTLVNSEPRLIPSWLASLCIASGPSDEEIEKLVGPHKLAYVRNYVSINVSSQLGEKPASVPEYSTGSILVKEKLSLNNDILEIEGVGGMIRSNSPKYKKSGGWEFFYIENRDITRGRIVSCIECHSNAPRGNFVYGEYTQFYIPVEETNNKRRNELK